MLDAHEVSADPHLEEDQAGLPSNGRPAGDHHSAQARSGHHSARVVRGSPAGTAATTAVNSLPSAEGSRCGEQAGHNPAFLLLSGITAEKRPAAGLGAKAAGCDQWPAAEGFWRRFLSRQAWGPRSTEVLSTGWAGRGVTEASPSQWWELRLFRIWSARRMARRASCHR